jgi:DNA-binding transcriptional LysR family regulator
MIRWDELRILLAVHRTGNLVRAAQSLDLDATTVSRRLAALERALDAKLLVKHQGEVLLTRAGVAVVADAERAEQAIANAHQSAKQAHHELQGVVRIALTESLAAHLIAPALGELLQAHPGLLIDLHVGFEIATVGREVDIALRIAPPHGDALRVRRGGDLGFGFYRSRAHRAVAGPLLMFSPAVEARGEAALRRALADSHEVRMTTVSAAALREAAAAGVGIAMLPCIVGDADGRLQAVAIGPAIRRPMWVVVHRDQAAVARVKVVADWVLATCRANRARLLGHGML